MPSPTIRFSHISLVLMIVSGLLLLAGCASLPPQEEPPPPQVEEPEPVHEMVTVTVARENLRATPNGTKAGEAVQGQEFPLLQRRGNWVQINHPEHDRVWIWAPSLGMEIVNPASVPLWLGDRSPRRVDDLVAVVGDPQDVEAVGGDVFWYNYSNSLPGGGSRFGTGDFRSVRVLVDRHSRAMVELEMELGPFTGSVKDLLPELGLPAVSSTKTNFERALFMKAFPGIDELVVWYRKGDFNTIERLSARRFSADAFKQDLSDGTKKLVPEGGVLNLSMDVTNLGGIAYAAPVIKLGLYLGDDLQGEYTVGPLDTRVQPGQTATWVGALPVGADDYDLNQLGARAEIISAVAVPAGPERTP